MLDLFQKIVAILLAVVATYFGALWVRKILEYASEIKVEEKIKGSKLSTIYASLSALSLFLAIEIYSPDAICIPFLVLFIGLLWLNHLIDKKTIELTRKDNP